MIQTTVKMSGMACSGGFSKAARLASANQKNTIKEEPF